MATDKVWWVKENNFGFASLNQDTGEFTAPTEDGFCHLYCKVKPRQFKVGISQDIEMEFDPTLHDLILWKVLQMAYERTAAGLNQAQYFGMKYDMGLKEAKKQGKSNKYTGARFIVPQDF
jgi:hypothetical protein